MTDGRMLWLDAIRVIAAQLIVLHHLSIYGPVAQSVRSVAPGVIAWLDDYGRIAVQVFLVMGGFLFIRSRVWRSAPDLGAVMRALMGRWRRLFLPFYVALLFVLLASIPGQAWIGADWVPQWPDLRAVLAHVTGLYDYLGIDALSAGAWYVTIDFQLHAVALGLAWLAARSASAPAAQQRVFLLLVVVGAGASLLWVNRRADWDFQPVYFFASFALGVAVEYLARGAGRYERLTALAILLLAMGALVIDWRLRIAVALACTVVLAAGVRGWGAAFDTWLASGPSRIRALARRSIMLLGDLSYALFLVHFSVCVMTNAVFVRFTDQSPTAATLCFLAAWAGSLPLAAALHRWVERPLAKRRQLNG